MYRLDSIAILHKTHINRQLTPADILDYIKYGYKADGRFIYTTIKSFGEYYTIPQVKKALQDIPDIYFSNYLEGTFDRKWHYIYEGILLYEDERPKCFFDSKII